MIGIGKEFISNEGSKFKIEEILSKRRVKIKFLDSCGYSYEVDKSSILKGQVANPYYKSNRGFGFYGVGKYKSCLNSKPTREYNTWTCMIRRVFSEKNHKTQPTYKNVYICEDWANFQIYAEWYTSNYPRIEGVNFEIDKDLLQQNVRDKIYSPSTCIFLPNNVNSFLTNKQLNNTSGYIGVSWYKAKKKWYAQISLFGENKKKGLGYFSTPEEASEVYKKARVIETEKVKKYLRCLNYLPEETIELIK